MTKFFLKSCFVAFFLSVGLSVYGQDSSVYSLPMRLFPRITYKLESLEDSVKMSKEFIGNCISNIDCGNYNKALKYAVEALLLCPSGEDLLICEANLYMAQINALLNNTDRARIILSSIYKYPCLVNDKYIRAMYLYNISIISKRVKSNIDRKKVLNTALVLMEEMGNVHYVANIYNILSYESETLAEKINMVRKSIDINKIHNRNYQLINNYTTMAKHYYDSGEYNNALIAADTASFFISPNDVSGYNGAYYEIVAAIHHMQGNDKLAYEMLEMKNNIMSLSGDREAMLLIEFDNFNRNMIKNEKIIEVQKIEFASKLMRRTMYIIIIILLLIIITILFYLINVRKNKRLQELEISKMSIEKANLNAQTELTNLATYLTTRNDIIDNVQESLKEISKEKGDDVYQKIKKLYIHLRSIKENNKEFEETISLINKDFIQRLCEKHPFLTKSDKNLACLLRANLSTKQIASIMNISDTSVNMARYRMRKNMQLDNKIRLNSYFSNL